MADESLPHDGLDGIDPALCWPATLYTDEEGKRVLEFRWIYASGKLKDPDSIRGFIQLRKAGRYTLGEVAVGLAEKTGVCATRWFTTITEAVNSGELKLKNYQNLADTLPYKSSKVWDYHHVLAADINRWLDSHPEYGASLRFDIGSQSVELAKAKQPATGRRAQQISAIQARPKGTRKDRMRVAIEAAEKALQGKMKHRPTADEVFDYLADDRDETGVIVDNTSEKLTWEDSQGKLHDIDRPTFANRLSRYRQPNHT